MSGWGTQDGGGWEAKADDNWGSAAPAPAQPATPQQPIAQNGTTGSHVDGNASVNDGGAAEQPLPAESGANPQWAAQGRTQYDYENFNGRGGDYDGNARVYHYDGEEGEVGPEFPELETELFGPPEKRDLPQGIDFSRITEIQLEQEGPIRIVPVMTFEDAGLHPAMAKNVELCQYKTPTPIQKYCLSAVRDGHDVIGIAQTGSGKTAAYLIPILNKLMGKAKKLAAARPNPATYRPGFDPITRAEPLVCVVVPTRELAIQIFMEARKLCYRSMLRPCVIYGGGPIRYQMDQLALGCDILVATPGRLIDFMDRPNNLSFRRLKYMVVDEADELLHDDWKEDLDKIFGGGEQEEGNIQYMLFSATFPKPLRELAQKHLAMEHVRFRVGRAGSSHENIVQQVLEVEAPLKRTMVLELLNSMPPARTVIFVNSKRTADELDDFLFNQGMPCTSIHADRTQREREDAMRAFRAGKTPILIATGVTARGIDVRNVVHVINYDLPSMDHGGIEEYTHRIGRTGRIGHRGMATSFYTERDEPISQQLVLTMLETNQTIPDFLQHLVPEGEDREVLKFESELDVPEGLQETGEDGGGGWGAGADNGGGAWGGAGDASGGDASGGGGWGGGGDAAQSSGNGGGWGAGADADADVGQGATW